MSGYSEYSIKTTPWWQPSQLIVVLVSVVLNRILRQTGFSAWEGHRQREREPERLKESEYCSGNSFGASSLFVFV